MANPSKWIKDNLDDLQIAVKGSEALTLYKEKIGWNIYNVLGSFASFPRFAEQRNVEKWALSTSAMSNAAYIKSKTGVDVDNSNMGSTRQIRGPRGTPNAFRIENVKLIYTIKPSLPDKFASVLEDGVEILSSALPDSTTFDVSIELHPTLHRSIIAQFLIMHIAVLNSMAADPRKFHKTATSAKDFSLLLPPPVTWNPVTETFEVQFKYRDPLQVSAVDKVVIKRGTSATGKDYSMADSVTWKKTVPTVPEPRLLRTILRKGSDGAVGIVRERFATTLGDIAVGDTLSFSFKMPSIHDGTNLKYKLQITAMSFVNDGETLLKPQLRLTDADYADDTDIEADALAKLDSNGAEAEELIADPDTVSPLAGKRRPNLAEAATSAFQTFADKQKKALKAGIQTQLEPDEDETPPLPM